MNTAAQRGIISVQANMPDLKATIAELGQSFEGFKAQYDRKLENLETLIARGENLYGGGLSTDGSNSADIKSMTQFVRAGDESGLRAVNASLSSGSDPDGGWSAPPFMEKQIAMTERDQNPMRGICRIVKQVTTGEYEELLSTGGAGGSWVSETESRLETSTPPLKKNSIPAHEISANPAATQKILDDSNVDVVGWLANEVAVAFSALEGAAFISGNGVGRPRGLLTYDTSTAVDGDRAWNAIQYVAGGSAAALDDADKLIDLVHSLRAGYRRKAVWMMSASTIATVRKLKDADERYLWRDSLEAGQPNTLLGYPVIENEFMPSIAAGVFPVVFGDFSRAYTIVDRIGIRVLRDAYTNKPYVHFYTTKRVGAAVTCFEAVKLLKIATS